MTTIVPGIGEAVEKPLATSDPPKHKFKLVQISNLLQYEWCMIIYWP